MSVPRNNLGQSLTMFPARTVCRRSNGASARDWCPTTTRSRRWTSAPPRSPPASAGTGVAARTSAALHGRDQRASRRSAGCALSGVRSRTRRAIHLSRARPARGLCDARPQAPASPTSALMSRRSRNGSSAPSPPSTCAASGARIASASGWRGPTKARPRGQDRGHRHPRQAMGLAARHRAQCRSGPVAFFRDRAVRRERAALRRDQSGRSRLAGDAERCRYRAEKRIREFVRPAQNSPRQMRRRPSSKPSAASRSDIRCAASIRRRCLRAHRSHRRVNPAGLCGNRRSWRATSFSLPANMASTDPSRRLRTQPCRPRPSALYSVHAR